MKLGKTIKKLRHDSDMTQEQLAEILSISPQAVSRWECGDGMPDISLIPTLCNLFNVTSDTLLGISIEKKEEKIKQICEKSDSYLSRGYVAEAREIIEAGLKEYPNSDRLLHNLMYISFRQTKTDNQAERSKYTNECIDLGNKVLEISTLDDLRHGAIQILCFSYSEKGEIEKARELAAKMPNIWISREVLLACLERGTARYKAFQERNIALIDTLVGGLSVNMKLDDGSIAYTKEEMALLREKAVAIIKLVFDNEHYGFYHLRLRDLYFYQANFYAAKNDAAKTLEYLNLAVEHTLGFLNFAANANDYTYRSLMFKGLSAGGFSMGNSNNVAATLLEFLKDTEFDFIRDTDDYKKITETLTQHAAKWKVE